MTEVGQILRQRREQLGLSLDDIQSKTKIRTRYLEAIENGNWDVLPGDVYTRGFIRSYADALNLDGFGLLKQLDEVQQQPKATMDSPKDEKQEFESTRQTGSDKSTRAASKSNGTETRPPRGAAVTRPPSAKGSSSSGLMLRNRKSRRGGLHVGQALTVIVILGALAGGWWELHNHTKGSSDSGVAGSNLTNTSANVAAAGNQTGNGTNNTANQTVTPPAPTVTVKAQPFKNGVQTFLVTTSQPLQVKMQVNQNPCWIQIVHQDSKSGSSAGMTIQANQAKTWSAQNRLTIRIGHYPGVTFIVNGKSVQLPKINHPYDVTFVKS